MKLLTSAGLFLSITLSSALFASSYKLDESHSHLGFKVRHLGISNVKGHFKKFTGTANFDEKTGKASNLKVSIKSATIDTNEPKRDRHLRSEDFFAVKKYPDITFVATKFKYADKHPTAIEGKLTLHGTTLPVTFKIIDWGGTAIDPWNNTRLAFEAVAKIDRTKFGLKWNKGLKKAAGLMVGNTVAINLEIEAIKVD